MNESYFKKEITKIAPALCFAKDAGSAAGSEHKGWEPNDRVISVYCCDAACYPQPKHDSEFKALIPSFNNHIDNYLSHKLPAPTVLIIDITSTTDEKILELEKLFFNPINDSKNPLLMCFISSDNKFGQSIADLTPVGEVRVYRKPCEGEEAIPARNLALELYNVITEHIALSNEPSVSAECVVKMNNVLGLRRTTKNHLADLEPSGIKLSEVSSNTIASAIAFDLTQPISSNGHANAND